MKSAKGGALQDSVRGPQEQGTLALGVQVGLQCTQGAGGGKGAVALHQGVAPVYSVRETAHILF